MGSRAQQAGERTGGVSTWLNCVPTPPHSATGFPGGSVVKNLPALQDLQETWVRSMGWENLLEKEMATHSSILAWKISRTEEPCGLQSMGLQSQARLSDQYLLMAHLQIKTNEISTGPKSLILCMLYNSLFP